MAFFSLSRKVRDDLPESLQRMSTPLFDHTRSICDPPELNRVTRRTYINLNQQILVPNVRFYSQFLFFFFNFLQVIFYYMISQRQNRFG